MINSVDGILVQKRETFFVRNLKYRQIQVSFVVKWGNRLDWSQC